MSAAVYHNQYLQLIYVSSRTSASGKQDIRAILSEAKEHNEALNIKGVLVVLPLNFFQVLEGPEQCVRSLMNKIVADERHYDVRVLSEELIPDYEFGHWTMVSCELNEEFTDSCEMLSQVAKLKKPTPECVFGLKYTLMGLANPPSRLL